MIKYHACNNPDCIAETDAMHVEPYPVYKVVFTGSMAEDIENAVIFAPTIESMYVADALLDRVSPIVFYTRLSDLTAIALADTEGVEVSRAKDDWQI